MCPGSVAQESAVRSGLEITDAMSQRLIRLPICMGMDLEQQEQVAAVLAGCLAERSRCGPERVVPDARYEGMRLRGSKFPACFTCTDPNTLT